MPDENSEPKPEETQPVEATKPEESHPESHEHGDSKVDDAVVTHDLEKAKEDAAKSADEAPHLPPAEELAEKSNTEGVGVVEMQTSRERHPFVE